MGVKRYSFRAYPTVEQQIYFAQTFGCTRLVANLYIAAANEGSRYPTFAEACKELTRLKKEQQYHFLKDVSISALQQALKDVTTAANNAYRHQGKGFPKFRRRGAAETFRITGKTSFNSRVLSRKWAEVRLPKISSPLRYRMDRPLPSAPSSVTVIKRPSGKYFVSFVVEVPDKPYEAPTTADAVGLDAGLTALLTLADSNGVTSSVLNPRHYKNLEPRLAQAQRVLSATQKGSKNRERARVRVARLHEKIANQRRDHAWKLVKHLVSAYGTLSVETLSITSMVKNHSLAKSIHDASWGGLYQLLSQEAEAAGRVLVKQDRFQPTTKVCSSCATVLDKPLTLDVREWECLCGAKHDRDVNAAKVLLSLLTEANRWKSGDSLEVVQPPNRNHTLTLRETNLT